MIMRFNKKEYAAFKTAQDNARKIKELTDSVLAKGGVTKAYSAIKEIASLNDKYNADFGDMNIAYQPNYTQPVQPAVELETEGINPFEL